jgi:hypothetical protein
VVYFIFIHTILQPEFSHLLRFFIWSVRQPKSIANLANLDVYVPFPSLWKFKNVLVFYNKLGRCLKNRVLENISPDNVISYCVCFKAANKDLKHKFPCLHAQQAKNYFIHTKRENKCARCVHVCDNSFKQFINS